MSRARVRRSFAGLITLTVFLLIALAFKPAPQGAQGQAGPPRRDDKPLAMPADLASFTVRLGLKDAKATDWDGQVQLSQGRLQALTITQGNVKGMIDGSTFRVRSVIKMKNEKKKKDVLTRPILNLSLEAPPTARVTIKTKQGSFAFALSDLGPGTTKTFLDGQANVTAEVGALRLTGPKTEDDYPALARGRDGTVWLAYSEYRPGPPLIAERLAAGNFEGLVPTGNGDQVLLRRFDGKVWQPPLEVSAAGLDVWRPTVAVDGKGAVIVAWSQQVDGNWDIYYRKYTPAADGKGTWSDVVRLTDDPGTDFHPVAATDAGGKVWLAWQGRRGAHFNIFLAALADGHAWKKPRAIAAEGANNWAPAIAADGRGRVYVAYDTYAKGNYDVRLFVHGDADRTVEVASSPRFEARPSVVCDKQDRVWIAYEEGDEQWGKDYATAMFKKIPLESNPGFALYINRTVRVKCFADGKLQRPAGDLERALLDAAVTRKRSVPRLSTDEAGGLWLLFRHHPLALGTGETWISFAVRHNGKDWGVPMRLAHSSNLMDNRPALAPLGPNVLAVYSSDTRTRTQDRDQSDLFAALLRPAGKTHALELVADTPAPAAQLHPVHPNEAADIARVRAYRIELGGKKLRLLRGEFHRHTEYSSHNDGDGMLEDSWRYALDAGALDWMGNGDHDNGFGHEYCWWQIQKVTDLMTGVPHFIGAQTYERSVKYPNGHRNVIMPKRGIRPLPRGDLMGTAEKGTPDTKILYAYLKRFGGICASHTSATDMGTDWRDNDPLFEPVVEIYQGHRHNYEYFGAPRSPTEKTQIGGYEPAGFVNLAFAKGYRFGFQSSSDHISTHISYGVVLTDDISRKGIIDAFKRRHSYAATDNIVMDVRSGAHLMGDSFETKTPPTLDIAVVGTAPLARLVVVRDGKVVHTAEPKARDVKLRWTDPDPVRGKAAYYYVRIEQADGNLAWASPMWITYRAKGK